MQQLILTVKQNASDAGLLHEFDNLTKTIFPCESTLIQIESLFVRNRMTSAEFARGYAEGYAHESDRLAERNKAVCALIQSAVDKMYPTPVSAEETAPSCVAPTCADTSVDCSAPSAHKPADEVPVVGPKREKIKKKTADMQNIIASPEHVAWNARVCDSPCALAETIYSYVIHAKQYDLAKFVKKHEKYVSTLAFQQLAATGDLDGLKWMWDNVYISGDELSSAVSRAIKHGRLPVLIWLKQVIQFNKSCIVDWKLAVEHDCLSIIQWYLVEFPTADMVAPVIYKYACDKDAGRIIEWLKSIGY